MLTSDLPALFGIMGRPVNRLVPVRDLPEFEDWLHVISDPIVVRVYVGMRVQDREAFKASLVDTLRIDFSLTLTCACDSKTLSRSQVNVPISAMSQALYSLGARLCRVSFYGMKWYISSAEPAIDAFIRRYREEMSTEVPIGRNLFNYGARFPTEGVRLFRFSDDQHRARRFREGTVHEMCNVPGYSTLEFRPILDPSLAKVKVYQEICHDILSTIPRRMLDDMPTTMFTMCTRLHQL